MDLDSPPCGLRELPDSHEFDPTSTIRCLRCDRVVREGTGEQQWMYCPRMSQTLGEPDEEPAEWDIPAGLERYELIEELGRGGMGVVYRARDSELRRDVALKFLLLGAWASQAQLSRFKRELRASAGLSEPGAIRVLDGGVTKDGMPWYSMELVEGPNLEQVLQDRGALPPEEAARVVLELARTLHRLHERGMAHRDVKPANVMMTVEGHPVLTDFGLVAHLRADQASQTLTVDAVGTPAYMAPEQVTEDWRSIDWVKVDVFMLGLLLTELLTNRLPAMEFGGMRQTSEIGGPLGGVCARLLEPNPAHRYASAEALARDLELYLSGDLKASSAITREFRRIRRRYPYALSGALSVLLVVATLAAGTLIYRQVQDSRSEAAAMERLEAAWSRRERLLEEGRPDEAEATFRAFVDLVENEGRAAWAEAWMRRAAQLGERQNRERLEMWATAYGASTTEAQRLRAAAGLLDAFRDAQDFAAMDVLVHELGPRLAQVVDDPDEVWIELDLHRRRFDRALQRMGPDDPRRRLAEQLKHSVALGAVDDQGRLVVPAECNHHRCWSSELPTPDPKNISQNTILPDGRRIAWRDEPVTGLYDGRGGLLCELPGPRTWAMAWFDGRLVLARGGYMRKLQSVDLETCAIETVDPEGDALNSYSWELLSRDVNADGTDELVVAMGLPLGFGLRALDTEGQVVAKTLFGSVVGMDPVKGADGVDRIAAVTRPSPSKFVFPDGDHNGVPVGMHLLTPKGASFVLEESHPLPAVDEWWMVPRAIKAGDIDGDGLQDLVAYADRYERKEAWIWLQQDDASWVLVRIADVQESLPLQLDDDPQLEIVANVDSVPVALGMGSETTPALDVDLPTESDRGGDAEVERTRSLERLGLTQVAAAQHERLARARLGEASMERWAEAARLWEASERPDRARLAWQEAARMGLPDAWERSLDAALRTADLEGASEVLDQAGPALAERKASMPTEPVVLDFRKDPSTTWRLHAPLARWNPTAATLEATAVGGPIVLAQTRVQRTHPVAGIHANMVLDRLEWAGRLGLRMAPEGGGDPTEVLVESRGGGGFYTRHARMDDLYRPVWDDEPDGPHGLEIRISQVPGSPNVAFSTRWEGETEWRVFEVEEPLDADTYTLQLLALPEGVDGPMTRISVERLVLWGLQTTDPGELPPIPVAHGLADPTKPEGRDVLRALLRVEPRRTSQQIAEVFGQATLLELVREAFQEPVSHHHDDALLARNLADDLPVLGDPDLWQEAPDLALLRADALLNVGRVDEALAAYRQLEAEALDEQTCLGIHGGLARIALARGQVDSARISVERALACAPSEVLGLGQLRRRGLEWPPPKG